MLNKQMSSLTNRKTKENQIRDDIRQQQGNIDKYRHQAQETIDGANVEIKRLQQVVHW